MNDDLHTLSGAYALHALPERDVALFEAHMSRCEACAVEVRGLSETAARLALGAAEPPSAAMKARVMTRIAEVRQEPPILERRTAPPAPPEWSEWSEWSARDNVVPLRSGSRWRGRILTGLAAVATAAAVVLGVAAVDAARERDELRQIVAVIAAPDARTVRQRVSSGGTGVVVMAPSQGRMLFTAGGLPPLPGSRVYELWLMGGDGVRSAGLLERTADGGVVPVLATPLRGDERVGLTVEPAGGSDRPTTTPIMIADLPAT
ncbi:anti-sigma factor [Streptosporangium sp. NBC_01469]|uniref:anti-sigma factor n=1 Tax=Streptosporangium sp. NBC_01469 TaxID=2903898 RepID=UPI002E2D5352|nr:anti-sigma factor [Streptosporangium sp. NBC_01469]